MLRVKGEAESRGKMEKNTTTTKLHKDLNQPLTWFEITQSGYILQQD
jgi:hypothetical protein